MQIISFSDSNWIIFIFILSAGTLAYLSRKLTLSGSVVGVMIAVLIYLGAGPAGLAMLAAFFILGTAATSYKKEYKLKFLLAAKDAERRTVSQVMANAGVAAILSGLSLALPDKNWLFLIMIAASFASATSDTFSSELGNVYGRNFYNISTFEKDERGLNGVISLEGTLFGILGSLIIGLVYTIAVRWSFAFFAIMISGIAGNLLDSFLGAIFERKAWLGNDAVNFLNTAFAALLAYLLMKL